MEKLPKKYGTYSYFLNIAFTYLDCNKNIERENFPNIARMVNKQCGTPLTNFDVRHIVCVEIVIF